MLAVASPSSTSTSFPSTPKRRKKYPSFSPNKRTFRQTPVNRLSTPSPITPRTESTVTAASEELSINELLRDPFPDLSLWNDATSSHRNPTSVERVIILQRLRLKWPSVAAFTVSFPWMLVEIDEDTDLPPPHSTPFFICGLVAVFVTEGNPFPAGVGCFGTRGEAPPFELPESVSEDLRLNRMPTMATFEYLHKLISCVEHISYPLQILFELYPIPDDEFQKLLTTLPKRVGGRIACYHNGEMLKQSIARVKEPDPRHLDDDGDCIVDDTNYLDLSNGGVLRPGCLLECVGTNVNGETVGAGSSNSGIVVSRNGQKRLTVAAHTWETDNMVYHGNQRIGPVVDKIGEDIGLVDVTVPVSNTFLSSNATAKTLVDSTNVHWGDMMSIDTCYTGTQLLFSHGIRTGKKRHRGPGPDGDTVYIIVEQGIFATNAPYIPRPPQIRLGMCGTPLLRVGNALDDSSSIDDGEICGFFLWTDIKGCNGSMLYAYCQPTDPLLENGWSIATDL